jgi:uncharacterized protein
VLQACLIDRVEHRPLFDQAFHVFWRDPELLDDILRSLLPRAPGDARSKATRKEPPAASRRLAEAMLPDRLVELAPESAQRERLAIDARLSWSDRERLRKVDFESMTTAEWAAAQRMVAALEPLFGLVHTRRQAPAARGTRVDLRALLRECARRGGDAAILPRQRRRTRTEPIVVIVDISGSMSRYSRMFLHFIHALVSAGLGAGVRVNAFVFGTRLTHITRRLKGRDPDEAIARVVDAVNDWSGGTRIGHCLKEFNQRWARRLPLGSATVLLVTDGLECADIEVLSAESGRLARSCRRFVWLNPLLRYDAFEPKARGVRALLPHVDRLLPVHNIESLERLSRVLGDAFSSNRSCPYGNER